VGSGQEIRTDTWPFVQNRITLEKGLRAREKLRVWGRDQWGNRDRGMGRLATGGKKEKGLGYSRGKKRKKNNPTDFLKKKHDCWGWKVGEHETMYTAKS